MNPLRTSRSRSAVALVALLSLLAFAAGVRSAEGHSKRTNAAAENTSAAGHISAAGLSAVWTAIDAGGLDKVSVEDVLTDIETNEPRLNAVESETVPSGSAATDIYVSLSADNVLLLQNRSASGAVCSERWTSTSPAEQPQTFCN